MKNDNVAVPASLLSHPIVFVDSYDAALRVIESQKNKIKEFFLITGNEIPSKRVSGLPKNITVFRIRPSGSWNSLFREMAVVEGKREEGEYGMAGDLMFVSTHTPHDISSALNRHRAVNHISCREMHWLDTLEVSDKCAAVETLDIALRNMPSVPAPVQYSRLSIQQRFDLTAFEFARFTRPVHCVDSVDNAHKAKPFYTNTEFGVTYQRTRDDGDIIKMTATGT